jgi:hypothetical protein
MVAVCPPPPESPDPPEPPQAVTTNAMVAATNNVGTNLFFLTRILSPLSFPGTLP